MSEKLGLVGRKIGMTRIFTEDGVSIPRSVEQPHYTGKNG